MSAVSSHARFGNEFDEFYDPNFTADISNKMRVPRRIRVIGNEDADNEFFTKPMSEDKLEMMVPGRILVAGQDHHIGLKSPPHELHLEQSMIPPPSTIRVQTPPRVITLDEHLFPTVDEEEESELKGNNSNTKNNPPNSINENTNATHNTSSVGIDQSLALSYPSTPPLMSISDGVLSPTEELTILRRHLAKIGRRVMVLEHENHQRQQREMILYSLGIAYFFLKTLFWLHRHW